MSNYKKRARSKHHGKNTTKQEDIVDQVLAFERFKTEIAPELQEMLLKGASTKQILKKFEPYAAARMLSIALAAPDEKAAISAIKDILDRSSGKATETKKIEHHLAQVDDKDIDQLILSELQDEVLEAEYTEIDEDEDED